MHPSVLRRSLAAAVSVFTLAALAVPAAATEYRASAAATITDPTGDVTADDEAETPVNEPRADVTAASAEYRPNEIALTVNVVRPTDPRTDPNWKDGASFALWGLDTTGDNDSDYLVTLINAGGFVTAGVIRPDEFDTVLCLGGATFDGTTYAATIDPACIGNPASFRWGGGMVYDTSPADENSPLAGDGAPDGDAMAGPLQAPAPLDPAAGGYWLVGDDGGIFSYNTEFNGSTGAMKLNQPIVGMAADPDGKGYWFVASDGGIFAFDAPFFGSTGAIRLNKPIVGMTPTPTGKGYWLVASDGGIFAFGDAAFHGSTGALTLNKPIAGMASSSTGEGYWLVASDGGIFAFGDAAFHGSAVGSSFPVVGIAAARDGKGYSIVRADGSVANRGSAPSAGSLAGKRLSRPIVGIAATI